MFLRKTIQKLPTTLKESMKTRISPRNQEIIKTIINHMDDLILNRVDYVKSVFDNPKNPNSSSKDNTQQQKENVEYLDHFERYKNQMLPEITAYYLNIKAKELDLSFELIDELYEQYGRCQVFPNIQTDDIVKDVSFHQSIARASEAIKIWAKPYGVESNSSSVVFYMKEVLIKLSKAKSEKIMNDFLKSKQLEPKTNNLK